MMSWLYMDHQTRPQIFRVISDQLRPNALQTTKTKATHGPPERTSKSQGHKRPNEINRSHLPQTKKQGFQIHLTIHS